MRPVPTGSVFCVPLSKDLIVKMRCLRWSRKLAPLVPPSHREVPSTSVSKRPSVAVVEEPEANGEAPVGRDGENDWPRSCCLVWASGTASWRILSRAAHRARRSSNSSRGMETLSMAFGYTHGSRLAETHWAQGWSPEHLMRRRLQLLHLIQALAKRLLYNRRRQRPAGGRRPAGGQPRHPDDGRSEMAHTTKTRQNRISYAVATLFRCSGATLCRRGLTGSRSLSAGELGPAEGDLGISSLPSFVLHISNSPVRCQQVRYKYRSWWQQQQQQ